MSNIKKGKIHIYTGDGKGKTTAALGLAIRALGNGLKVGIIFFDKGGDYYGERKILDELKKKHQFQYQAFGLARMEKGKGFRFKNTPEDLAEAQKALLQAKQWMKDGYDLLILDEINTTVKTGLLKSENIVDLIAQRPPDLELVLTGRYCPPEIIQLADLATEMQLLKHYISQGQMARPGIEY
ncbi:MAG: cob(I)yrinic acid a,c-diamide adenosyltransferase [Patescibacteria group bacterium]|jgi:cob(I)alamin adenosyltransferase